MDADLTCPTCMGSKYGCWDCSDGRRKPELREWDALRAERDRLRAVADAAMQIFARRYITGGPIPHDLIAVNDDAVADLNKALQVDLDARAALDAKERP